MENNNNNNNNNKEVTLSSLSNKKRGNGETIDLNAILSLNSKTKKKRLSKKQQLEQEQAENGTMVVETNTLDTSKPIKWDKIQIDKLDSYLLDELAFIARSIGIATSGVRKYDLKNKIKLIIKVNKEAIENKLLKDTLNPFNKTSFAELVIPEGQDGINELLFWKIFKNKSIFKRIMSFMNEYPNKIPYDYYINVTTMLINNQIGVLKDKVKRNQYLFFNSFWELFKMIKDDKEFYQSLFTNYKFCLPFDKKNRFTSTVEQLVQTNCVVGLQVLIEDHGYIPTLDVLKMAFRCISIDCVKLILCTIPETELSQLDQRIQTFSIFSRYKHSPEKPKIGKIFKCIKLFIDTFKIPKDKVCIKSIFSDQPFTLRLKDLIKSIQFLDSLDLWFEYENSEFKFHPIWVPIEIKTETTAVTIQHQNEPPIIPTDQIRNEFKMYTFSNEQLNSKLNDPINYKSKEKENIKKIFYVYNRVTSIQTDQSFFAEYYICYGSDQVNNGTYNYSEIIESIKPTSIKNYGIPRYALEYCHYPSLRNWLAGYMNYRPLPINDSIYYHYHEYPNGKDIFINLLDTTYVDQHSSLNNENDFDLIFSKCKENRELQIQFINSIINDIKSDKVELICKLSPMFVFVVLVAKDDLELVQLLVSKLGKEHIKIESVLYERHSYCCMAHSITKFIKSKEMLDYVFNEFPNLITNHIISSNAPILQFTYLTNNSDHLGCEISDLELLKHYQQLVINNQHNSKFLNKFIWVNVNNPSVKLVKHVLDNNTMYRGYKQLLSSKPCDFDESIDNQKIYFTSLKNEIITNCDSSKNGIQFSPLLFYNNINIILSYPPKTIIQFYQWLINYKSNNGGDDGKEFIKKYLYCPGNRGVNYEYIIHYFIYGGDDKLFNENVTANFIVNYFNGFSEIIRFAITRGDLETLDRIIGILLDRLEELPTPPLNRSFISLNDNEREYNSITNFIYQSVLMYAVQCNQLLILEYLYLNYNQILKKRTSSTKNNNNNNNNSANDSLFTQPLLSSLVGISLSSYNVKLSEFLLSLVSITKETFKKAASVSSKNHFKNRF